MHASRQETSDWEVTEEGLFVATRDYLIRRGYCCANRCRNCPYINWCSSANWQPIPAEKVRRTRVSIRATAGAQTLLEQHEKELQTARKKQQRAYHQSMIAHYRLLLERWGGPVPSSRA